MMQFRSFSHITMLSNYSHVYTISKRSFSSSIAKSLPLAMVDFFRKRLTRPTSYTMSTRGMKTLSTGHIHKVMNIISKTIVKPNNISISLITFYNSIFIPIPSSILDTLEKKKSALTLYKTFLYLKTDPNYNFMLHKKLMGVFVHKDHLTNNPKKKLEDGSTSVPIANKTATIYSQQELIDPNVEYSVDYSLQRHFSSDKNHARLKKATKDQTEFKKEEQKDQPKKDE
jgi:hypothetical protein